jgi:hypothetical protein
MGANVYVDSIDADYLYSMNKVKDAFNEIYPDLNFQGEIYPNKIVINKFANDRLGMLFSGGLDSTSLYIQNRSNKPDLFTMIGGVIPSDNHYYIRKMKNVYGDFAQEEKLNLFFIESDVRSFLNEVLLSVINASKIFSLPWWEAINHGIVQLSLCAPITIQKISNMKIALTETFLSNFGADERIVGNIRWAGIDVIPEGYEYNRQEKIHYILKKFVVNNYHPKLQVCIFAPTVSEGLNCGYCEKCSRDIISLIVEGINPEKCGFKVYDDFFEHAKKRVIPTSKPGKWTPVQKLISDNMKYTFISSSTHDFFYWFKNYDFSEQIEEPYIKSITYNALSHLFARLPIRVKNLIMNILNRVRKKKHWLRS